MSRSFRNLLYTAALSRRKRGFKSRRGRQINNLQEKCLLSVLTRESEIVCSLSLKICRGPQILEEELRFSHWRSGELASAPAFHEGGRWFESPSLPPLSSSLARQNESACTEMRIRASSHSSLFPALWHLPPRGFGPSLTKQIANSKCRGPR